VTVAEYRSVYIQLVEALRLYDLTSIRQDLTTCLDLCVFAESAPLHGQILSAITIAIPISYFRAFGRGSRNKVPPGELEAVFSQDELELHTHLKHYRDQYIAHSRNRMEAQQLKVWLNPKERGGMKVNSVSVMHEYSGILGTLNYKEWAGLCRRLISWIDAETRSEEEQLKAIIAGKYTIEEVYAMPSHAERELVDFRGNLKKGRHRYDQDTSKQSD